ncbi:MAG: sulfurtransferase TusA family protein [Bacillota bacterium]
MLPKLTLDISKDACPITFVKAKMALEGLHPGDVLEVRLKAGEAVKNVPRSLSGEGHKILSLVRQEDGTYILRVEKDGAK